LLSNHFLIEKEKEWEAMSSTPHTLVDSGAATPATTNTQQGHQKHHHHHHTGRRLRHFLRPDGKKVHIAGSPEEANVLRNTLAKDEKDVDFDLVIHGSPEHV
jgi:ATP sulfurylase